MHIDVYVYIYAHFRMHMCIHMLVRMQTCARARLNVYGIVFDNNMYVDICNAFYMYTSVFAFAQVAREQQRRGWKRDALARIRAQPRTVAEWRSER